MGENVLILVGYNVGDEVSIGGTRLVHFRGAISLVFVAVQGGSSFLNPGTITTDGGVVTGGGG